MDRSTATAAVTSPVAVAPLPWKTPRLTRMGTVAALTSAIDNQGANDGGFGNKKRT